MYDPNQAAGRADQRRKGALSTRKSAPELRVQIVKLCGSFFVSTVIVRAAMVRAAVVRATVVRATVIRTFMVATINLALFVRSQVTHFALPLG
jgi:hypothetical protein